MAHPLATTRRYIAIHIRRGDKVNNTAGRKYPAEGRLIHADVFFERARWIRRMSLVPACCDVAYVAFDVQADLPEIQQVRAARSPLGASSLLLAGLGSSQHLGTRWPFHVVAARPQAARDFNFTLVVDPDETRRGSPLFMWARSKKVRWPCA